MSTPRAGERIRSIETVRTASQPNLLFVRVTADDGVVGLGEAFFGAKAVEGYIHETAAAVLLDLPHPTPELLQLRLRPYLGYQGAGAETRGNAALDLALWDLLGRRTGRSIAELLGGPVRDRIPVYNTCAGPGYIGTNTRQESANWGVSADDGPWEDLRAFFERPGELATSLLESGVRGMKIWPFDRAAEDSHGTDISAADLAAGVRVVETIRSAVGTDMRVMIELHGLWHRSPVQQIIDALGDYQITWIEDPLRPDAVDAMASLRRSTDIPLAVGETAVGRRGFLPLLGRGSIDIATLDLQWCGGMTEARKVAALADAYAIPIAPHDCTGPVSLAACLQLVMSQPNGLVQETVRAFMNTWYREFADGLPPIEQGSLTLPAGPGHGVDLRADVLDRPDVTVTRSSR